jgi:hypothetical protein
MFISTWKSGIESKFFYLGLIKFPPIISLRILLVHKQSWKSFKFHISVIWVLEEC